MTLHSTQGTKSALRGLSTLVFGTTDLKAAKAWYTEFLGVEPYFDTPAYVEFRIGDYQHEFGLLDTSYLGELGGNEAKAVGPSGAIMYWHVEDVQATLDRLVELGATLHHPPRDFGEGFVGASVIDPFGNILGIMRNPHYIEVLASVKG